LKTQWALHGTVYEMYLFKTNDEGVYKSKVPSVLGKYKGMGDCS
jgi:hypothetical protein